jgi:hypothetical protein
MTNDTLVGPRLSRYSPAETYMGRQLSRRTRSNGASQPDNARPPPLSTIGLISYMAAMQVPDGKLRNEATL